MEDALISISDSIAAFTDRNEWVLLVDWLSPKHRGTYFRAYRIKAPYHGARHSSTSQYVVFIVKQYKNSEEYRSGAITCTDETNAFEVVASALERFKSGIEEAPPSKDKDLESASF